MKRLIITLFIATILTGSANAQNASNDGVKGSELRVFQNFGKLLDQFSYSMMVEDIMLAQKIKARIIRSMEAEIRKTQIDLDIILNNGNSFSKRNNYIGFRSRTSGIYSKRNGYENYEINRLFNQLEDQKSIKYRFENINLIGSRRRTLINKRDHRKLMYQFRDIMRNELEYSRQKER